MFYRCNECKKNLCITCQNKHNKEHKCINYDDKNYMCNIHNEKYNSFCNKCNKNIYLFCKSEYKAHEIINYENILQNINEVKDNLDKLKKDINEYKRIIDDIINKLNNIKNNIGYFYNINQNIYDILKDRNINYEILYSYDKLNKSTINSDIKYIINDNNDKLIKLNEIYNKINNKITNQVNNQINNEFNDEITIIYKINNYDTQIKIFGYDFVKANKDICKIKIKENEYEIKQFIELNAFPINSNILNIKLKGIKNIINMKQMFYNYPNLNSIPDLSKWNTSNVEI